MKTFLVIIFNALILSFTAVGSISENCSTEPQQIVSITKELHPPSYYNTQLELWKKEIASDDTNANAWLNFYLSSRIVNMLTPERNPHDLNDIYEQLSEKITGTYEYEYLSYLNGKGNHDLYHHLEKAYVLDAGRTEIYSHMVNYHLIEGNEEEYSFFCKKWMESGEISSGILSWNYNALIGLEPNAILLTYGDNDTYPSWLLQEVDQVRSDVEVINVHLLKKNNYRKQTFEAIDIPALPAAVGEEIISINDLTPLVDHLMQYSDRPLYFNVTLPKKVRESYEQVLYTVGLAFKYSPVSFDNISVLKENYEQNFLTDYLRMGFAQDESATVLNSMNLSYIPAFIPLYKHYVEIEETEKSEELKKIMLHIGRVNNKEEQILSLIATPRKWKKDVKTYINIKYVDKSLKPIKPGLWAAESETMNETYDQFLMDLLKNKEFELLELCKTQKTDWMSMLPEKSKHLSEKEAYHYTGGTPDDPGVPVNNITYEAALAYCDWLTLAYNGYDKKKKYQKVKFRLPSEAEWEMAARGKHKNAAYPWGGNYHRNQKGCYLANFYSSDGEPCVDCKIQTPENDGGFFPVHGTAYFPNDFGLYGMSGNVAEMIQGGTLAKGGSWEDLPEDCTISSKKTINGKSPAIGFRVFMEVLD